MTVTQSRIEGSREGLPDTDVGSLPPDLSARRLLSRGQLLTLIALLGCVATLVCVHVLVGVGPSLLWWGQLGVGAVTAVYIVVISFKLVLILAAHGARTIELADSDLHRTSDAQLPGYTVLVPLHREGKVLRALVERLTRLDYPRDRLQILLLVEEDDDETRTVLATVRLEPQFEVVVIPPSHPRTKPKACNVGLARASGELCVIYDAEDRPEPDQLRKAATAFRQLPDWEVCVQAELQYWNPWTNWLTRCFAAEYAVNFGLVLRGLDRLRLPIPLGGTSNHFRADALRELGGWDPHNVTEDADLGIRIARRGWGVRMMRSVTEEEANSHLGNWLRQRSRWIKGYVQTWLVHMRSPLRLWRELGTRRFLSFQLMMGFSTFTALVNPVFWLLTVLYLLTGPERIQALFPPLVLYLGLASMLVGNLLIVYYLMIGCMERGLHRAVRTMLSVPVYWVLMSAAAYKAVGQLLRPTRRHYWELTRHGLVGEALEGFGVFEGALDGHPVLPALPALAMVPETGVTGVTSWAGTLRKKVLALAAVAIALTLGVAHYSINRADGTAHAFSSPRHATSPRAGSLRPRSGPTAAPAQSITPPPARPRPAAPRALADLTLDTAPPGYVELEPGSGPSGAFDLPTFLRSSGDPAHDGAMFSANGFITGFARSWRRQELHGPAHMVAAVFEFGSDDGAMAVLQYESKKTLARDDGVTLDVPGGTGMQFTRFIHKTGAGEVYGYDVTFHIPGGRLFYLVTAYPSARPPDEIRQLAGAQMARLSQLGAR